ncbi:hypothetical protein BOX15_Mlig025217g2 [Macrostomum lignano]|uniref:Uncharacterized protein n=1 Tax=Macrostomum lignano TaxID=282301 RepID=A0A267GP53_9PLAT|nr:hypothetical protein BOX15_Mlig025217g2 [Macrostomum lignano]
MSGSTTEAEPKPKPEDAAAEPTAEQTPQRMTRYGAISTKEEPLPQPLPPPQPPKPPPLPSKSSRSEGIAGALRSSALPKRRRTKEEKQIYEDSIKGFMDALLSNSSLLAISNIVKRNHPVLKTLWAIALCLCLILSIRQLYSLTRTYLGHPKSTTIELSYKPFDFPSVTFCNHNPLRRSRVELNGPSDLQSFFSDLLSRNYSVADNGTQLMTQQSDWLKFEKLISNISVLDRLSMGYQHGDFILQCNFAGKKCDPDMFSVSLTKTYGNCFTFNGWQSVRGFERPVAKNGREHGLIMTLFLELDEYLPNFIPSAGVKVQLHEPGSMGFPEYSGSQCPRDSSLPSAYR